jgi:predicted small secreted protein
MKRIYLLSFRGAALVLLVAALLAGCNNPASGGGDGGPGPVLAGTVSVAGTAKVGETLTAVTDSLKGEGPLAYLWQFAPSEDGEFTAIADAEAVSYTLTAEDEAQYLRVEVSRRGYTGILASAAMGPVAASGNAPDVPDVPDVFVSVEDVVARLRHVEGGETPGEPYTAVLGPDFDIDRGDWELLNMAVKGAGKYLILDLGNWTFPENTVPPGHDGPAYLAPANVMNLMNTNQYIKGIILPENLEAIGDYAFRNCQYLVSITIPESLTYIGSGAFSESGISSLVFGPRDSPLTIEESSFYNAPVNTIVFADTRVEILGDYSFPSGARLRAVYPSGGPGTYVLTGTSWARQ